jgi:putative tryptophan/tyrosine transport system substrate-binding protein
MRRREFITLLGGATVAWPRAVRAQQARKLVRIGFLTLASGPTPSMKGFQHGLQQLGYVEGQNLVLIYRWADGRRDRLADLASELLQLNVDVIASNSTEAILAIRDLNNTIPVVMTAISDPIGNRLVASFARPGGNITGVTLFSTELAGKRLELRKEVVPQLARVGLLVERDHPPTATFVTETQAAAQPLNLALQIFEVHPEEIPEGFRSIEKEHPDALIVQQTASFISHAREIAGLAINLHLPTVSEMQEFIQVGGLLAYGPSGYALGERAAWYVDRILKGTRPDELPVEQPTKFELVVNLKTAKVLGLIIPGTMLARADELID